MRVLVTRPAREAQRWAGELQQRGIAAVPLPLIDIAPAPDPAAVRQAWQRIADFDAVMFVSGNAVHRFFMLKPAALETWPNAGTRAWAPGPGTRDALSQAGIAVDRIDHPDADSPQFDSAALWTRVRGQVGKGGRVLLVRGGDAAGTGAGRDWLGTQLAERGVTVETVVAYRRQPPRWTPEQRETARASNAERSLWLFSSSEAIANLQLLLPQQPWHDSRAVVTHPRIAQAATDAGFGVVWLSRPALADVVASIESIR